MLFKGSDLGTTSTRVSQQRSHLVLKEEGFLLSRRSLSLLLALFGTSFLEKTTALISGWYLKHSTWSSLLFIFWKVSLSKTKESGDDACIIQKPPRNVSLGKYIGIGIKIGFKLNASWGYEGDIDGIVGAEDSADQDSVPHSHHRSMSR